MTAVTVLKSVSAKRTAHIISREKMVEILAKHLGVQNLHEMKIKHHEATGKFSVEVTELTNA